MTTADSKFSTINEEEVLKFDKLAKEWWSPNGPVKLLHGMNPLRVSYIRRQYSNYKSVKDFNVAENSKFPFEGLKILDIGCGGGLLSEVFGLIKREKLPPFLILILISIFINCISHINCTNCINFIKSLVRLGASVFGADVSSENIQIAKIHSFKDPILHSGPGKLEYQCTTAGIFFLFLL